jgi:hypothetical protein
MDCRVEPGNDSGWDDQVEEFLQWKPLAEPHFQEAVARVGKVNTGGSMWSDLKDRAAKLMSEG